jgi:hypothetical protein
MATTGNRSNEAVFTEVALLKQAVDALRGDLVQFGASVSETLKEQGKGLRGLQDEHLQRCGAVNLLKDRVDDLEKRVAAIETLVPVLKIILWVMGALGASVIALIWALITGEAQVIFP